MSKDRMINNFGDCGLKNLITTCVMLDYKLRWGEMIVDIWVSQGLKYRLRAYPQAANHIRVTQFIETNIHAYKEVDILSSYPYGHRGVFDSLICLIGMDE